MPTVRFDSPREKQKIAQAKAYGNRVKEISYAYNEEVERIWRKHMSSLKLALKLGEDTSHIVDVLVNEMRILLMDALDSSWQTAMAREGLEKEIPFRNLTFDVPQCNIDYYEETLDKYKEILTLEMLIAQELGLADELELFLLNPKVYMSGRENGIVELQERVPGGKGVSYSFLENMKKLGISAAALSYSFALYHIWKSEGAVQFYYGVRNSSYPCSLCDSYAYMLIPMAQGMVYPLHNRCVCSIVPVYQSDMS